VGNYVDANNFSDPIRHHIRPQVWRWNISKRFPSGVQRPRAAGLFAGGALRNIPQQQIYFYGSNYPFDTPTSTGRFPLQCMFAGPLQYSGTMSCQVQKSSNTSFGYLSTFKVNGAGYVQITSNAAGGSVGRAISHSVTLTAIPLY
jgi:hypothetical protein